MASQSFTKSVIGNYPGAGRTGVTFWYLANPTPGSGTLTATRTGGSGGGGGGLFAVQAVYYANVLAAGIPDATNQVSGTEAVNNTLNLTTIAANCWILSAITTGGSNTVAASTGATSRLYQNGVVATELLFMDSNSALAAGANSYQFTGNGASSFAAVTLSLPPSGTIAFNQAFQNAISGSYVNTTSTTATLIGVNNSTMVVATSTLNDTVTSVTWTVNIVITPSMLPSGTTGTPYSQTLSASGGTGPYTWSITAGALPTGLTLHAATGIIDGTPTVAGAYNFTVTATDSLAATGVLPYTVNITAPSGPVISAISAAPITSTTAQINWTTDVASDSTVNYGLTAGYGSTMYSATLVTSHAVTLTGLTPSTLYHYQVQSSNGTTTSSGDNTFTTSAAPVGGTTSLLNSHFPWEDALQ